MMSGVQGTEFPEPPLFILFTLYTPFKYNL